MSVIKRQLETEQDLLIEESMWSAERSIDFLSKQCRSADEFRTFMPRLVECISRGEMFLVEQETIDAKVERHMEDILNQEQKYGEQRSVNEE